VAKEDPVAIFRRWYAHAERAGEHLPDAVALATSDRGRPSVRFVLLKGVDDRGVVFYTNLGSPKARHLRRNPRAEMAFYWDRTGRQVRIGGRVVPVSAAEADAYWNSRPRISRLGGIASRQSAPMPSRAALLARLGRITLRYAGRSIPRPAWWSGFRILPDRIEFWTRRAWRLHDRALFQRIARGWKKTILQP